MGLKNAATATSPNTQKVFVHADALFPNFSTNGSVNVTYLQSGDFCRFFKKCMGITFLEYQNELHLSYIYQDILSTNDSIREILERHGFSNYKLFHRMFHEHFQATPTEIRKQQKHHN